MTGPLNRNAVPLDEDAYQRLKSQLQAVYLKRHSDIAFATFLDQSLKDRAKWKERCAALSAVERRIDDADQRGAEPDLLLLAEAADLTKLVMGYEPHGFAATGGSGAGKSRLMDEALLKSSAALRRRGRIMPLLRFEVPAPCTLRRLGSELMTALGYPVAGRLLEHEVWDLVRTHLRLAGVDVLYLDEIQNVTEGANVKEAERILDTVKHLMKRREHPVILVMAGLPSFDEFAEDDDQVRRRIGFVPMGTLSAADVPMVVKALQHLAAIAGLEVDDTLETGIVPRLIHAGQNQFGTTMEIAVASVLRAARPIDIAGNHLPSDVLLSIGHFAKAFAERSGCAGFANPFVAPDWHKLDVSRVNVVSRSQLGGGNEPRIGDDRPPKRRGKGDKA